jgi:hypothetical protein
MELLDRYLPPVALALALAMYAVGTAGIHVAASPRGATISAAVQHAPLVVGLRLEFRRGCLTLAVLAGLREERDGYAFRSKPAERDFSIDESSPYALLCRLGGMATGKRAD